MGADTGLSVFAGADTLRVGPCQGRAMTEAITLTLASATLGLVALAVSLAAMRARLAPAALPLGIFLLGVGVITLQIVVASVLPGAVSLVVPLALPGLLVLGPSLYLYVVALTAERDWRPDRATLPHLILPALGLACAGLFAALPGDWRDAMILRGETPGHIIVGAAAILAFGLVLAWVPQSAFYLTRTLVRLGRYRRRLKDLFASNEARELHWIGWLVGVLATVWALAVGVVLADNLWGWTPLGPRAGATLGLALTWFMAVWGLRQKPGFEGRELPAERLLAPDDQPAKYTRSGVSDEQAARLARKIEAAMREDQLYLDPELSLHRLAAHVGAPAHRVSQILNETLGECFFDYVNRRRVEAAQPLVEAGEASIVTIAYEVGFNARSSFYKAFKRVTGVTPTRYREQTPRGG